MAGDVDDVIHASQYPEIAVHGQHRAVGSKIRPVVPVLAVWILAVLGVVLVDEALRDRPKWFA